MLGKRVILECDARLGDCERAYTGIVTSEFAPKAKAIALTRYNASRDGWLHVPALISADGQSKDICKSCKRMNNLICKYLISESDAN